ncbi:MAG: hypothetical protein ACI4AH_06445 [Muribaculaceae bacterium]
MNENVKTESNAKTQVYNVIILDRSGSMSSIRQAAVDGFNETLASIKKAQEKFADTQNHYVSLVTFCSCETKNVFDKVPVAEAHALRLEDYEPCCCTPLYDAMGFTLTSMQRYLKDIENYVVVVTIITDGYENASQEYNGASIKALVEKLKGDGWTFTYMGANQDSIEVAISMSIRNSRNFEYSARGTKVCMKKDANTRMNFYQRIADFNSDGCASSMTDIERKTALCDMADEAFDDTEKESLK